MLISRKSPEFNAAPAAGATLQLVVPIKEAMRLVGISIRCIGYSASTAKLIASAVVTRVRVSQDTKLISTFKPSLLRKVEELFNSNSDTLDVSQIFIPFDSTEGGWGTDGIGQILIEVDVITPLPANTAFSGIKAFLHYVPLPNAVPRGDIVTHTVMSQPLPIAGWNEIQDLKFTTIVQGNLLYLDNPAITEVEIWLGSRLVWQGTKEDVIAWMLWNRVYKQPSGVTHVVISGQTTTSTGGFPVLLDAFGILGDGLPLFAGGVRQDWTVKFYWDTGINAVAAFDIYASGIERGVKSIQASVKA